MSARSPLGAAFRLGPLVLAALLLAPAAASAQEPQVFRACYAPESGIVYRIGVPDAPAECRSDRHVEFSWIDGVDGHEHHNLNGLADDDHPEYVREGEAAGGDLGGTYPEPAVVGLRGRAVSDAVPSDGQFLGWDGPAGQWTPAAVPDGATDHGALTGLSEDDHPQYLLADGVRNVTDGFAVTGTFGSGTIPAAGAGVRLMWYPGKAAFRTGQVLSEWDEANVGSHSVAMGRRTIASGATSTALGLDTEASGLSSTALGYNTTASGSRSIAMGYNTTASGIRSMATGFSTTASGGSSTAFGQFTTASGAGSTAIGGVGTTASGDYSIALGHRASTNGHSGAFVYGDRSTNAVLEASADNQFAVRAQHIWLGTNNSVSDPPGQFLTTSTGAYLSDGGAWTDASSREWKEAFRSVDADEVLRRVAELPVSEWSYESEPDHVRHMGPVAEDFHAAFGLGASERHLASLDVGGVSLAAIQALERRTAKLRARVADLRAERESLERRHLDLLRRVETLERRSGAACRP